MVLYPLWAPIFTMIKEVWPHANRAVVTNNLTVIIEVVFIEGFLYSSLTDIIAILLTPGII